MRAPLVSRPSALRERDPAPVARTGGSPACDEDDPSTDTAPTEAAAQSKPPPSDSATWMTAFGWRTVLPSTSSLRWTDGVAAIGPRIGPTWAPFHAR